MVPRNIHPFDWNLKDWEVPYLLKSNSGELEFSVNTAGNEWSLSLKWGLEQPSDQSDDDEKKVETERERERETVDVIIRKLGDQEVTARIWTYCDEILCGNITQRTFSNKWRYLSDFQYKNRFSDLHRIKFHGFVELMDDGLALDSRIANSPNNTEFNGKFEWNVNAKTLKVLKNASKEEHFWSKSFEIGDCIWTLQLYPNSDSDSVYIQLCLLMLPSNVREVTIRFNVKLNEFEENEFIHKFNYVKDRVYCPDMSTEQFISLETLRLLCQIEIISMNDANGINHIDSEENKYDDEVDSPHGFELKLKPEEVEIFYNPKLTDKKYAVFRSFWLKGIKWKFVCYPNGNNDDAIGFTLAYLYVTEYPPNVNGLKCRFWVICNEGLYGSVYDQIWDKKKDRVGYGWGDKLNYSRFGELKDDKETNGITFLCHIEILEYFSAENPIPEKINITNIEKNGEFACKKCASLMLDNGKLREINNNMMHGFDRLLMSDKGQSVMSEGDLNTQKQPMMNSWNDKVFRILDEKKRVKQEMEELQNKIDSLHEMVVVEKVTGKELHITALKATDGKNDEITKVTQKNTEVTEPCKKCTRLESEKESLQNENSKLEQRIKALNDESKQDEQKGHDTKNDDHELEEMLQHLFNENDILQREQYALKAKEKELRNELIENEKELNEKEQTIKTLSESYDAIVQQMKNKDDEKSEKGSGSNNRLALFLSSLNLKKEFYDKFKKEGFVDDFEMVSELTDGDLSGLGINKKAQRIKILRGIRIKSNQIFNVGDYHKNEGSQTTKKYQ